MTWPPDRRRVVVFVIAAVVILVVAYYAPVFTAGVATGTAVTQITQGQERREAVLETLQRRDVPTHTETHTPAVGGTQAQRDRRLRIERDAAGKSVEEILDEWRAEKVTP